MHIHAVLCKASSQLCWSGDASAACWKQRAAAKMMVIWCSSGRPKKSASYVHGSSAGSRWDVQNLCYVEWQSSKIHSSRLAPAHETQARHSVAHRGERPHTWIVSIVLLRTIGFTDRSAGCHSNCHAFQHKGDD